MRLHRLTLSAFGPYPGEVEVDFDALGEAGLFLLHGDTGVGKTSLLDAVAFALYGTVPGPRGQAKRLRCDAAEPHTRTVVTLELSLSGRRLLLTRSPEYLRPKTRGDGTTKQPAKATLTWLDEAPAGSTGSGGPAGLTGHREVGDAVLDLIGMSADQFFQVVLLPQGEFARFLRSDTAEREQLLERLFDTGRFADIEEAFASMRRESGQQLRRLSDELQRRRATLAEASTSDAAAEFGAEQLAALARTQQAAAQAAETTSERAQQANKVAAAELAALTQRAELVRSKQQLLARHRQLAGQADEIQAKRKALAGALAAAPVMQARATADGAASELQRAAAAERRAARRTEQLAARCGEDAAGWNGNDLLQAAEHADQFGRPPDAGELRRLAATGRELAGTLAAVVAEAGQQGDDERRRGELTAELAEVIDQITAAETTLGAVPGKLTELRDRLAAAEQAAVEVPGLKADVAAATAVADAADTLQRLQPQLADCGEQVRAAIDAHQHSRELRQQLTERRFAGMAAELAAALADGEQCPVCGAGEHPHPARPSDDQVSSADVAAAQQQENAAAEQRTAQETRLAELQRRCAELTGTAAGLDSEQAVAARDAAAARVRAAAALAGLTGKRAKALQALEQRQLELQQHLHQLTSRRAALVTESHAIEDRLRDRAELLRRHARPFATVAERRQHVSDLAGAREQWAAAVDALHTAIGAATRTGQALKLSVEHAGFADLEAAAAAATAVDIDAATAQIRSFEDQQVAVTARLADPQLAEVDAGQRLDLAPVQLRAADAEKRAAAAIAAAETARRVQRRSATAIKAVTAALGALAPVAARDAELTALADVVAGRGQNARALSLRSYVLAARLRQVAEVAGQRLLRMSGQRYSFVHSAERESRGRSGGLGLDILDAHTGTVRPAKTLSGGESFLASLALALALADVVAAESGGQLLDTVFVDEGFGTLDAQTLDVVMDTLDDLRADGRTVGLVSHVDDLRQRIPTRLHVRRTPAGPAPVLQTS